MSDVAKQFIAQKVIQNHGPLLTSLMLRYMTEEVTLAEFDSAVMRIMEVEASYLSNEEKQFIWNEEVRRKLA